MYREWRITLGHFRHLEDDVPRMADHLGSDLDELVSERSQGSLLHALGQCQTPQKIAQVVGQCEQLKTHLIVHEIMT